MNASMRRRWVAGACLGLSLLMLLLGLTIVKLTEPLKFLLYWGVCILLTALAGLVALMDLFVLRRQFRRDQKELIEETIRQAREEQGGDPSSEA